MTITLLPWQHFDCRPPNRILLPDKQQLYFSTNTQLATNRPIPQLRVLDQQLRQWHGDASFDGALERAGAVDGVESLFAQQGHDGFINCQSGTFASWVIRPVFESTRNPLVCRRRVTGISGAKD